MRSRQRGLSLVEVLLATALATMILGAVGTALVSVSNSVRVNDRYLRSRQAASSMMNFTLTKIRRAKLVRCEPVGAPGNDYSRVEIMDDGTWNKDHYDSPRYTVIELSGGKVYVGSGNNANALTVTSGMQPVLSNVAGMNFHSIPAGGVHDSVTVELTLSAIDAFSNASTEFSLTGSAALRAMME